MQMKVGANRPWSQATRAKIVLLGRLGMLTCRWRMRNQVAAQGPKTTVGC